MKILAIETSCDDTAIAVLETSEKAGFKTLSNIVASQIKVHQKYGGVYPTMAKREHQKNLVMVLNKSLQKAKMLKKSKAKIEKLKAEKLKGILERETELFKKLIPFLNKYERPDIDMIAVTNGPGLEPCLWVGINFAKALSWFWNIPVVSVNHIESHILVNFSDSKSNNILFPAVCLVVSGGHTQLILIKDLKKYELLGETRDDAAGECFDKCAKILGLEYPGGPIISKLALKAKPKKSFLPRPMINTNDYDFSFSGLKTAVLYHHRKQPLGTQKSREYIKEMAAEIQQAIIDVLVKKTAKAAKDYNAKTIILGGGVSANKELRKQFLKLKNSCKIIFPLANLSIDNALMTAIAGFYCREKTKPWKEIKADGNLRIV